MRPRHTLEMKNEGVDKSFMTADVSSLKC